MNKENEIQIQIESEFKGLNISDKDSNSVIINHKNCYDEKYYKPWCKNCVPSCIIEGWTSENHDIDKFIKDTIYDAKLNYVDNYPEFLEWVPFDRFEDISLIGKGGFSKVFSATWIDGQAKYKRQADGNWKKLNPEPIKVALKRLEKSQNISVKYLNELKMHWKLNKFYDYLLRFYGMTKDPETKEFVMIVQFAEKGDLRSFLSNNFNKILWKDKLNILVKLIIDLEYLHKLGYFHKDLHSGNILLINNLSYISDFMLSGSPNEKESDNNIYGVLPYVAPEVLVSKSYTLSSDIYSFGVIMVELSSGERPFCKRKYDEALALEIIKGLRPEFGRGTPEIYKKLAYKCMNTNPEQRPTASELWKEINFWYDCTLDIYQENEQYGYKGKVIKAMFEEADEEIPYFPVSYEINPNVTYTSKVLDFVPSILTEEYHNSFPECIEVISDD
ncbi:hypothetical protein RclHR1_01150013 [Rhizophagus clarus]|uniref:Kinase-like domain-containing protein n=1 Tax=Rhizophagus clarus TaxID=94130 RepID=A0A2Z6QGL4_9GLOM|nr:hypothetical protein RclHR1_01150013 [Rhizophagus clarus]GES80814.1 kinase-like domain-containing protein [Rhizophagus clarus]